MAFSLDRKLPWTVSKMTYRKEKISFCYLIWFLNQNHYLLLLEMTLNKILKLDHLNSTSIILNQQKYG